MCGVLAPCRMDKTKVFQALMATEKVLLSIAESR